MLSFIGWPVQVTSKLKRRNGRIQWNPTSVADVCIVVSCILAWYEGSKEVRSEPDRNSHMNMTDHNMTLGPYGRSVLELPIEFIPSNLPRAVYSISTCIWFDNHFTPCDMAGGVKNTRCRFPLIAGLTCSPQIQPQRQRGKGFWTQFLF